MPRQLLDILKNVSLVHNTKEFSPNVDGYAPGKRETAQQTFLSKYWKGRDHGHPYGNEAVLAASNYKQAKRPAGKDNVEFLKVNHQFVARRLETDVGDQSGLGEDNIDELTGKGKLEKIQKHYEKTALSKDKTFGGVGDKASRPFYKKADRAHRLIGHRNKAEIKRKFGSNAKTHTHEETMERQPKRLFDILGENVTRKHFRAAANTIRAIEDPKKRQEHADLNAKIYSSQNPRFSHEKWHSACGTKNTK